MTVGGQTMPTETTIGKTTLHLVVGDIAEQDTDAVVTAAHWRLNKGHGTDGTIHSKPDFTQWRARQDFMLGAIASPCRLD